MNKTILRNIHLINWYGFSNRTIPVSENLTLISGENECGKSTILDAIKYAYTGDTQFNKATSGYNTGVGKRNLVSYTRCLVDASAGIYARPADKIPVVYTHIALEYFDQINENPFVLGVVIETAVTDIRGTHWYALDGKRIADISFVYEEDSLIKPYDASGFQKKYGVQMKTKKEGITLFMQMIGLKLPYQEVPKYQRKLRNIMASDVMQMDSLDVLLNEGETEEKQVFVVTPEKLLFILRQDILFIANIGLIIFDEGHLFDDMSRGITYELLISTIKFYMKDKMQKILISAVIPNAEQVNEWITNGSGVVIKNNIIQTTEKVVGIADIRISRKEKKKYAYLFFVNPQNPDEEEFFVPRVIGQVPLELKKRESKERLFPEINNDKYKNDIAIALSVNLCVNGGTAIFCGKKETANKILNRIIEIKERGFDISKLTNNSDLREVEKLSYLIECEMGKESDYYKASKLGAYAHHGGMPMGIRSSIEYAMQVGKIKFIACTSTFANVR